MTHKQFKAAIIGGGVIGGGWAARFLLQGWDVTLYDPDPDAQRRVDAVLANAKQSLPGLYDVTLPEEGRLSYVNSIAKAVEDAHWVQESVPERLAVKRDTLQSIVEYATADAVVASSTSGFKPSELAASCAKTEQILVAHPYNPVYLLPLVELVPHPGTHPDTLSRAQQIIDTIGMTAIVVNKEIDAHIGDRLLEALWREALWLVKDGYATTQEIDDIIRYSFGLRWAQMGLFETYRVAGGEAGMRHFLSQFAPALKWPWSPLTDVPELDQPLIDKIASQSDQQSDGYTILELEQQRDKNLVAILRALKRQDWAAGHLLNDQDRQRQTHTQQTDWRSPVATVNRVVPLDWVDDAGFMDPSCHAAVIKQACEYMLERLGCDASYIEGGYGYRDQESTIIHQSEARAGDQIQVLSHMVNHDGPQLYLKHEIYNQHRQPIALANQHLTHVDLKTRQAATPREPLASHLIRASEAH